MQLTHIPFAKLSVSTLNMRHARKAPDISDILPSIRARGILQPLLVRPSSGGYEIVAGRRRYFAAKAVKKEKGRIAPLPCAVMDDDDDAAAIEASLIENAARLDPDAMTQYETFTRLVGEGRSVADIAATFGLTETQVKQRLALGDLLPQIRCLYRDEQIDASTLRYLTLATKQQQQDWLTLFEDEGSHAPRGHQLKQWLFGGESIPVSAALFPLEDYPGEIVSDLFGDERFFADTEAFWAKQNEAVAAKRDAYLANGWRAVEIMEPGRHFSSWEYEKTPKKKGGKVIIAVSHRGEVEAHEGYLTRKEAKRAEQAARAEASGEEPEPEKAARPEVTQAMQNYIDLHRHAAARAALAERPDVAHRLMLAHLIAGSGLWSVKPERQQARGEAIAASLASSPAQIAFATKRADMLALLGLNEDRAYVAGGSGDGYALASVFARLLALSEDEIARVTAYVMAETLEAGTSIVEAVGNHLAVDMSGAWTPDDTFFDLIRDREIVNALVAEVAGRNAANANVAAKTKLQKQIIRDCLAGTNGRQKVENWLPRWLAFPAKPYTKRGGFASTDAWGRVRRLFKAD